MNSKCPNCGHHFGLGEKRRLTTWRSTRRAVPCPNCAAMLIWERHAFLRTLIGLLVANIFNAIAMGVLFASQIGSVLGFVDPQSLNDPYWKSSQVRTLGISYLSIALVGVLLMLSGIFKLRLVRCQEVQPVEEK